MLKLFKSKTIIVNVLTLSLAVLAAFKGSNLIAAYPEIAASITAAIAAINVVLRFLTTMPLSMK